MRIRSVALVASAALLVLAAGCSSDEPAASTSSTTTTAMATTTTAVPTSVTTAPPVTTPANQVISATVAGGKVTPAAAAVDAKLGSTIIIEVTSDVADEVHVHGYDKSIPVPVGQPQRLELLVNIPGQFEVELEDAGLPLFTLRVS